MASYNPLSASPNSTRDGLYILDQLDPQIAYLEAELVTEKNS